MWGHLPRIHSLSPFALMIGHSSDSSQVQCLGQHSDLSQREDGHLVKEITPSIKRKLLPLPLIANEGAIVLVNIVTML